MSQLSDIEAALDRIRRQLPQRPAFLSGHGVMADDPKYAEEIKVYDGLRSQLSLLIQRLRNHSNLLAVGQRSVRNLPPSNRYSAAASLSDRSNETDKLLASAKALEEQLDQLAKQNGLFDVQEWAAGRLLELQDEHLQDYHVTEVQVDPHGQISPAHLGPGSQGGSTEAYLILSFALLDGLVKMMKRRK